MSPEVGQEGAVVLDIGGHDLGPDAAGDLAAALRGARTPPTVFEDSPVYQLSIYLLASQPAENEPSKVCPLSVYRSPRCQCNSYFSSSSSSIK